MGPCNSGFWFPWLRLGGFFLVVVIGLNLVFARPTAAPAVPASPEAGPGDRDQDYFGRKKRQLERHYRTIERFLRPADPDSGALPSKECVEMAALEVDEPSFEESDPVPVLLPEAALAFPGLTPAFLAEWSESCETSCWLDAGQAVFAVPELILDGFWNGARLVFPRPSSGGEASIVSRLLDFSLEPRRDPIFTEFLGRLAEREQRFFAKIEDSPLGNTAFEEGEEDVDLDELVREQKKVLWDVVRKTYFSKYRTKAEDRIRDEAFYFSEWRGLDFAVLPPLIAGYVWYRGLEKKISINETYLRVTLEPVREWLAEGDDLTAGLTVEWAPKSFPVGLVLSAGLYDGKMEMDFIGIGTSAGAVRKLLFLQEGERP